MCQKDASEAYGVSRRTLMRHINDDLEAMPETLRQGSHKTFTDLQEDEVVKWLLKMSKRCFGITRYALSEVAYELAVKNNIPHHFNPETKRAGQNWVAGFLKRHSAILSPRRATPLSYDRAWGFNKRSVDIFFDNLEAVLRETNFHPSRIYNMDESGTNIVPAPRIQVIAERGARDVPVLKAAERGRRVSIVAAISATGDHVPPVFLFPGHRDDFNECVAEGPPGSLAIVTPSGYMISTVFVQWLQHFKNHCNPTQESPVLLILDNHSSHMSLAAVLFCQQNFIELVTIPPHTSHKLQPLDKGCFSPLKSRYAQDMLTWLRTHPGLVPTIKHIPQIIKSSFEQSMRRETIVNAFRATGIWIHDIGAPDRNIFKPDDFLVDPSTAPAAESAASNLSRPVLQMPAELFHGHGQPSSSEISSTADRLHVDESTQTGHSSSSSSSETHYGYELVTVDDDGSHSGIVYTEDEVRTAENEAFDDDALEFRTPEEANLPEKPEENNENSTEQQETIEVAGPSSEVAGPSSEAAGPFSAFPIMSPDELESDKVVECAETPKKKRKQESVVLTSPEYVEKAQERHEKKTSREKKRTEQKK